MHIYNIHHSQNYVHTFCCACLQEEDTYATLFSAVTNSNTELSVCRTRWCRFHPQVLHTLTRLHSGCTPAQIIKATPSSLLRWGAESIQQTQLQLCHIFRLIKSTRCFTFGNFRCDACVLHHSCHPQIQKCYHPYSELNWSSWTANLKGEIPIIYQRPIYTRDKFIISSDWAPSLRHLGLVHPQHAEGLFAQHMREPSEGSPIHCPTCKSTKHDSTNACVKSANLYMPSLLSVQIFEFIAVSMIQDW